MAAEMARATTEEGRSLKAEAILEAALALFADGATVPFIARYRKEKTGEMNEIQLRSLMIWKIQTESSKGKDIACRVQ